LLKIGLEHQALSVGRMPPQAPQDGYVITLGTQTMLSLPIFTKDLKFDPIRDLPPINIIVDTQTVWVTNPTGPFTTFDGMVRFAKANPGKLNNGAASARSVTAL
jgi:tripartite-type tricarboxylate transporter receptor subunit TctC